MKKQWKEAAAKLNAVMFNTKTNTEQIDSNVVVFSTPITNAPTNRVTFNTKPTASRADDVPHHAYTQAMSRKAHRYACLKAAQAVGEIDWKYTAADWTVLKASNNIEGTMLVTVRMAIPVTEYERRVREYNRMAKARAAKANKEEKK